VVTRVRDEWLSMTEPGLWPAPHFYTAILAAVARLFISYPLCRLAVRRWHWQANSRFLLIILIAAFPSACLERNHHYYSSDFSNYSVSF